MRINIIGGGVIGLFSAWHLQEQGHEIHLFDKTDLSDGCSHGNAGMITPSHFIPLAAPGVVSQGIRWMFKSSSPFFIKPRLDTDLLHWLWRFYRSCNARQASAAMPVLLDFNLLGKQLYRDFYQKTGLDFKLEERGILMLYQTPKKEKEELETAEVAATLGVETQAFDRAGIADFESGTAVDALGGVYYPGDAHLYPNVLMSHLRKLLEEAGAVFHQGHAVSRFEARGKRIRGLWCGGELHTADLTVLAAGSWSAKLLGQLGVKLLLQDGKGYSITLRNPAERPSYASILTEAKVAVTPMGGDLRFGGTLELGGLSSRLNMARIRAIAAAVPRYYPNLKVEMPDPGEVWHGFRPCSPDGLPYIGRVRQFENLVLATGHAMMGLSLAPATGRLVADIVAGDSGAHPEFLRFFDPGRF
jgi:D-amino-acid dehydrogenase